MIILDKNIKIICITKKYCYLNFMRSNPPFDPRIQTIGINQNGPSTTDTIHTHYLALSGSPNSIGSKLSSLYIETEYV